MAGLEVIRTLNDHKHQTDAPIELVVWTNEEGSRFSPAMMGPGAYAGIFPLEEVLGEGRCRGQNIRHRAEAHRLCRPRSPVSAHKMGAYFEAHIEQGPILEAEEKTIGIVTGAQGQRWYEITVVGQDAHAGPTPMPRRKDALVGAARMIDAVNKIGHAHPPHACATVGFVQVSPTRATSSPARCSSRSISATRATRR